MLDRHSELAVAPETAFYDEIAPRISAAKFNLRDVLAAWTRLPELGLEIESVIRRCGPVPTTAALLGGLLDLYAENHGKRRGGEKTPQHLRHVPRILAEFPDARVLCLVRDGRDVALSLRSMPWWPDTLSSGAYAWLEAIRVSEAISARHPESFQVVRYEDLVQWPEVTLDTVMRFLDLEFQACQLKPAPSDVVLARSLAWKGLALGPLEVARVGRWRTSAVGGELDYLNNVLGSTLNALGYRIEE